MKKYLQKLDNIKNFYHKNHNNLSEVLENEIYTTDTDKFIKKVNSINAKYRNDKRPLHIAVVGNFSTGKSTFINSLLQDKLLGMKIEPATAKITKLMYGSEFKIQKVFKNNNSELSKLKEEISLKDYQSLSVHKDGVENKDIRLNNVHHFEIYYNKPILNEINISDTPGFSSMSAKDDTLTKKWIEKEGEVDLLIWLIDINKGVTKQEADKLKSFANAETILIINKADDKFLTDRIKIQKNISENHRQDNFLYSAKTILDYKLALKQNKEKLKKLLEQANRLFEKGENFTINFTNDNVEINHSENNIKIDRILLESQDNIASYIEYDKKVNEKFKEIKKNISELKHKSIEREITELYNNETEKINLIKNKLKTKRQNNINKYENIKKKLEEQYRHIDKKSEKDFKNFRTNLFNQIYKKLFDIDYVEGGIFSSDKHIVSMKKFDENKIKQIDKTLNNSFTNFYKLIFNDAKKLLKSIEIELDENSYEIKLTEFIKNTYVEASSDSLYSIYYLWQDMEYVDDIKKAIDFAIADERIYQITLEFLQVIYNEIEGEIENEINNQNSIINQLLDNLSKL